MSALLCYKVIIEKFCELKLLSVYLNNSRRCSNGITLVDIYCFFRHLTSILPFFFFFFFCNSASVSFEELIFLCILMD